MLVIQVLPPIVRNTNARGVPKTLRTARHPHTCTWNGKHYRSDHHASPLSYLARALKADGCPNQPWRTIGADGQPSLRGPNLDRLAAHVLVERDPGRLEWVLWKPFPTTGDDHFTADDTSPGPNQQADDTQA